MTSLPKITPDNLLEIEARANAATKGPWTMYWEREGVGSLVAGEVKHTNNGLRVADWLAEFDAESLDGDIAKAENDGEFISHARQDVPALCAALREAWAERDAMHEAFDRMAEAQADSVSQCNKLEAENKRLRAKLERCERTWSRRNTEASRGATMTPEDAKRLEEIENELPVFCLYEEYDTKVEWLIAKVRELDAAGKEMHEQLFSNMGALIGCHGANRAFENTSSLYQKYGHLFAPTPEEGK